MDSPQSGYELVVDQGVDRGRRIPLRGREIHLGRALAAEGENRVTFTEPTMSRLHASLVWVEARTTYELHDKSQTNPTRINGKKVGRCLLKAGDVVEMGSLKAKVVFVGVTSLEKPTPVAAPPKVVAPMQVAAPPAWSPEPPPTYSRPTAPPPAAGPPRRSAASNFLAPSGVFMPPLEPPSPEPPLAATVPLDIPSRAGRFVSGLQLIVTDGPDQGASFALSRPVLFIGRSDDYAPGRGGSGILLRDPGLAEQQVMLVWNRQEGAYKIHPAEGCRGATYLYRQMEGEARTFELKLNMEVALQMDDVIEVGASKLRVAAR